MEKIQGRKGTLSGFLASRKVAITLLIILILLSVLGTMIPQEALYPLDDFQRWRSEYPFLSELAVRLDLTRLYTSFVYIAVSGLLCLSISVCTYKRALGVLKGAREERPAAATLRKYKNFHVLHYPHSPDKSLEMVCSGFKRRGYRFPKPDKGEALKLRAEKGGYGVWGSLFFHFSFLLILTGALVSTWTRFEGKIILTEGQTFKGYPHEYLAIKRPPLFSQKPLAFQLHFQRFKLLYGPVSKYMSEVSIEEDTGESYSKTIRNFHALSHQGYTFYQKDHGFSPSFVLKSSAGKVLFDSFVAFKSHLDGDEAIYEDLFIIPGSGLKVQGRLYPDMIVNKGKIKTKSPVPNNPVVKLKITKQGKEIWQGLIKLNQDIRLEDFVLSFNELRYWSSFRVVKDPGIPIIYTGFFLGILGLIIRILFIQEHIWVVIEGKAERSTITLAGKAERDKTLFTVKFESLVADLGKI